jgi:hypothetical protein
MRSKLALIVFAAAAIAVATGPATAQAKTIKLYVSPKIDYTDICRINPGSLRFSFLFGAKFTRKNSPYPKSVQFKWTVTDNATGAAVINGTNTLTKRNKWKSTSVPITLTTGGSYIYTIKGSFRSPTTHKLLKRTFILPTDGPDQIPTDQQLDTANPPVPACV